MFSFYLAASHIRIRNKQSWILQFTYQLVTDKEWYMTFFLVLSSSRLNIWLALQTHWLHVVYVRKSVKETGVTGFFTNYNLKSWIRPWDINMSYILYTRYLKFYNNISQSSCKCKITFMQFNEDNLSPIIMY
jgi:hypothetical protein